MYFTYNIILSACSNYAGIIEDSLVIAAAGAFMVLIV